MHTNTAEIENQPVNFPYFAVEKRTYKPDPFGIRDGHYIGSDGFVVPKDFNEFYERFPQYVRKWVSKHGGRSVPKEDLEDRTQDLLIHLLNLPQTSKHREAGKKDIVQTFDPVKHYGANQARFRNYVNLCLTNKFRTIHSKLVKDASCQSGNLSLDWQTDGHDFHCVGDRYCHEHSAHLRLAAKALQKQAWDRAFLEEFVNFVGRKDPNVLPTIEALRVTGTQSDTADWLGLTESEFGRMRTRLSQLGKCFQRGEPVPKQRGPYQKLVAKTKRLTGSQPNRTQQVRQLA